MNIFLGVPAISIDPEISIMTMGYGVLQGRLKQFQNQLAVAWYFTEEMGVATENQATLRGVIGSITPDTDVSSVDKIVQIIGTIPPGG